MNEIFAICRNQECKNVFVPPVTPIMAMEGDGEMYLIDDIQFSPCPKCGSDCYIPKDTVPILDKIPDFIKFPVASVETLTELRDSLKEHLKKGTDIEKVEAEIATAAPALTTLSKASFLSKDRKESILFWIQIITFLILIYTEFIKPEKDEDIKKMFIDHLVKENEEMKQERREAIIAEKLRKQITPLNKPCPCGSGKLFKWCHGIKWRK